MTQFYLTTAIDYVNSRPHLGTAYEKIAADVIARYKRLAGFDTHFVMGNDEHSQNVYRRARELGEDPKAYCDRMAVEFTDVWRRLDISFDDFIRTTDARHQAGVQELVRRMAAAGDIYEGDYEGWYCVSCEAFKQEKDLVEGLCPIHRTKPEWLREKNYFFRLSKYADPLRRHYTECPDFIVPVVRRNEILRLVESGLEDISVSRAGQAWGIPMPDDPSSVIYVWVDALINYITAVGYGTDAKLFERWWPAHLHIVGKDITRFHCVIWPAMLMSAGLALPKQVFGHGWLHLKGEKMSKSLGTIIDPLDAVEKFGPDPLRLYLVKEITFGSDGDFIWERFEDRYNVDLANNLGNLVSRIGAMADKYRGGSLAPGPSEAGPLRGVATQALQDYRTAMEAFALEQGAAAMFRIIDAANEHIASTEPWALARDPKNADRLSQVLFDAAEAVRIVGVLLLPIMPKSAAEILRRVGETRAPDKLRLADAEWNGAGERVIEKGNALWPRLDSATSTEKRLRPEGAAGGEPGGAGPASERERGWGPASTDKRSSRVDEQKPLAPATTPASTTPASSATPNDRISIDDFMKVDLRTAKVLAAEKVPNSRKLVKLSIDVGTEQRTLVAGIAEAYEPEQLVGRTIVMVFNLKPAKLMGIESNGMVLAASPDGGKPILLGFDQEIPPGVRVR
ncbi:MAG: methionine--tRNA ligase [Vicinamibacterales bacterium]